MSLELGSHGLYQYTRTTHKASVAAARALEQVYLKKDGTKPTVVITPSGNAAVNTALNAAVNLWKQVHLVCDQTMYNDSKRSVREVEQLPHVQVHHVDFAQCENVIDLLQTLKNKCVLLFCETCANPTGTPLNPAILRAVGKATKSWHAVLDNSFLTHVRNDVFNEYGDVDPKKLTVVASCSKHYSAGTCIAGFVATNHTKLLNKIYTRFCLRGYHVPPETCVKLRTALETMPERCLKSSTLCRATVGALRKLFLAQQPGGKITLQYATNTVDKSPDVFNVRIALPKGHDITRQTVWDAVGETSIQLATSYGGSRSRICNYVPITDTECCVRVSCGYGETEKDAGAVLASRVNLVVWEVLAAATKTEPHKTCEKTEVEEVLDR